VVVLGAVQMFVLGMIGEYLGRLYVESKRRPLYLVADVAGPVRTAVHPTTPALVLAAARLAEGLLAAQQAARDELLLARFLPLLDHLRDEPAALLTTSGRVLASNPEGWLPERVPVTPDTGVLLTPLPEGAGIATAPAQAAGAAASAQVGETALVIGTSAGASASSSS